MTVVATGSIAFDYILSYAGRFRDHILLEKTHILNLSFLVDRLEKRRGGVAANYAYNLALLGYPSAILATAGRDAGDYHDWLAARGIDVQGLRLVDDVMTATGFTTTDSEDNQLTGYYGGAMLRADALGLDDTVGDPEVVIVGPNAPAAMARLVRECRDRNVRWVYDPSHQLSSMDVADLKDGISGAWILIGNDYELELIQQRTESDLAALAQECGIVVTTKGRHGSRLTTRSVDIEAPAAAAHKEVDPTGAGDAYRAGLVASLLQGLELDDAALVASLAAVYVVEQTGTVEHEYTRDEFAQRFATAFGKPCPPQLFKPAGLHLAREA
ncbi:MAG: carbohydrate kinase family protein [Candidatus Dormibacteraeota bacterium]|nr:carbohydrate kinase family protein [Candidatus Dormibacteraeota bacterium]